MITRGFGSNLILRGFLFVEEVIHAIRALKEKIVEELGERRGYIYLGEPYNLGHSFKKYTLSKKVKHDIISDSLSNCN